MVGLVRIVLVVGLCLCIGFGCKGGGGTTGAQGDDYGARLCNASNLHEVSAELRALLSGTFERVRSRLGPLRYRAKIGFSFAADEDRLAVDSELTVESDAAGTTHVQSVAGDQQVEVFWTASDFYVRSGLGRLRKKPIREISLVPWSNLAFSGLREALEVFYPRLSLAPAPRPQLVGGREALVYQLQVTQGLGAGEAEHGLGHGQKKAGAAPSTPVAVPPRWRELASPLSITGELVVDKAECLVLAAEFRGKVKILDREVRPTQLSIDYSGGISDIGTVAEIVLGESVPEVERYRPPRQPLSFFASELGEIEARDASAK